jgi:outer membrane protease
MKSVAIFLFLVSISFTLPFLEAEEMTEESAYAFRTSAGTGLLYGKGEEILYYPGGSNLFLSQLLWDFKPLVYISAALDFGPRDAFKKSGFVAAASLKYGFVSGKGIMEDRDWLSPDGQYYLTHYSRHNAYARGNSFSGLADGLGSFIFDAEAGYSVALGAASYLRFCLEITYMRFSWMSEDGYTQYAPDQDPDITIERYDPWDPTLPKTPYSGKAISYTQDWITLSPGFSMGIKLSRFFYIDFTLYLSPFIYGVARDEHLSPLKHYLFLDYLSWGLIVKETLSLGFSPSKHFELKISAGIKQLGGARGEEYVDISATGNNYGLSENNGGGGFSFGDFSLSATYTF